MARQDSFIKLKGKIGDLSFYKTGDGYMARAKGGVDGNRVKTDPSFKRTRENGAEFGRAGLAGKLMRTAFRPMLLNTSDGRVTSRLTQDMMKVLQADVTNDRGLRNVLDGELELLQGFEFNIQAALSTTLFVPYVATIDRATGEALVSLSECIPEKMVTYPAGSTHVRFVAAAAAIDFENNEFVYSQSASVDVVVGPQQEAAIILTNSLPAGSSLPLFLIFGIEFYQHVNAKMYALNNGAFNALTMVKVSK